MKRNLVVQGRLMGEPDLEWIRAWVGQNPAGSRWRLSRELATHWDWRNGVGRLKDMAARTLLVKLHQRGLIALPPRRQAPPQRMRGPRGRVRDADWDPRPIQGPLAQLGPLTVQEVSSQAAERAGVAAALRQFHYLGFSGWVGQNAQYVVREGGGRPLACLVFGAAAWKCQDRDRFIGWSVEQRQRHLGRLANNSRFLILPWVLVPGLASWILGQISRRIAQDWQTKYGQPVVVLESFVERPRFAGTAYRAANWLRVGQTRGRTRQDRGHCLQQPVKDIYLYPLRRDYREVLGA